MLESIGLLHDALGHSLAPCSFFFLRKKVFSLDLDPTTASGSNTLYHGRNTGGISHGGIDSS